MLIGVSLMILIVLAIFSMIFGETLLSNTQITGISNVGLINGSTTTFSIPDESTLFFIDTSDLIVAGLVLLSAIIIIAGITGIQILGSGLSPSSVRVIILLTGYLGIWFALSTLAFNLIITINVFGSLIYIVITLGFVIGVIQKISGSSE